jgi:hypothetical protein
MERRAIRIRAFFHAKVPLNRGLKKKLLMRTFRSTHAPELVQQRHARVPKIMGHSDPTRSTTRLAIAHVDPHFEGAIVRCLGRRRGVGVGSWVVRHAGSLLTSTTLFKGVLQHRALGVRTIMPFTWRSSGREPLWTEGSSASMPPSRKPRTEVRRPGRHVEVHPR